MDVAAAAALKTTATTHPTLDTTDTPHITTTHATPQEGPSPRPAGPPTSNTTNTVANTPTPSSALLTPQQRRMLQQVFARGQDIDHDGLSPGFLEGPRHQQVVRGRAPRHRGVLMGTLLRCLPGPEPAVVLRCVRGAGVGMQEGPLLKRGDGVVFDGGAPDQPEQGGAVWDVQPWVERKTRGTRHKGKDEWSGEEVEGEMVKVVFGRGQVDTSQLMVCCGCALGCVCVDCCCCTMWWCRAPVACVVHQFRTPHYPPHHTPPHPHSLACWYGAPKTPPLKPTCEAPLKILQTPTAANSQSPPA